MHQCLVFPVHNREDTPLNIDAYEFEMKSLALKSISLLLPLVIM